jgi:hypothetical protein
MDIKRVSEILDSISIEKSNFEFENFYLESSLTPARQVVTALQDFENLTAKQLELEAKLSTEKVFSAPSPWEKMLLSRQLKIVEKQLEKIAKWLNSIDTNTLDSLSAAYEIEEDLYWTNYLGRQSAIEIMTIGRVSKETMHQMALLPVDTFKECVNICIRYANLIKDTTGEVEASMGIRVDEVPGN